MHLQLKPAQQPHADQWVSVSFVNQQAANLAIPNDFSLVYVEKTLVTIRENSAQSIYHAMQSRFNGRFFKNSLSLGGAYTWSKTIDNSSEICP